jgi:hypothetical protein
LGRLYMRVHLWWVSRWARRLLVVAGARCPLTKPVVTAVELQATTEPYCSRRGVQPGGICVCVGTARADSRRSGVGLAPRPQALPMPAAALVLYIYMYKKNPPGLLAMRIQANARRAVITDEEFSKMPKDVTACPRGPRAHIRKRTCQRRLRPALRGLRSCYCASRRQRPPPAVAREPPRLAPCFKPSRDAMLSPEVVEPALWRVPGPWWLIGRLAHDLPTAKRCMWSKFYRPRAGASLSPSGG